MSKKSKHKKKSSEHTSNATPEDPLEKKPAPEIIRRRNNNIKHHDELAKKLGQQLAKDMMTAKCRDKGKAKHKQKWIIQKLLGTRAAAGGKVEVEVLWEGGGPMT